MVVWTHAVLGVLYACVLYFCVYICSAQWSMFHMERCSRNTIFYYYYDYYYCPEAKKSLIRHMCFSHQLLVFDQFGRGYGKSYQESLLLKNV